MANYYFKQFYFYCILTTVIILMKTIVSGEFFHNLKLLENYRQLEDGDGGGGGGGGCRYRNLPALPPNMFSYYANYGCYLYTRPDLFIREVPICGTIFNGTYEVPGIEIDDDCVPFDDKNIVIRNAVQTSYINVATYNRWLTCCNAAQLCCANSLQFSTDSENHCPAVWDGWSCFDKQYAGSTVTKKCSQFAYSGQQPACIHYSSKECYANSTWKIQTDYSTCSISPRIIQRNRWHTAMLSISIIVCVPAILILIAFKALHTQKFYLIRNLLIVIVFRNMIIIITKSTVILDELTSTGETIMTRNNGSCKFLAFLERLSTNAFFACLLLIGIYLHQLLTKVFASRKHNGPNMLPYYIIVGGISILTAITWSITMAVYADEYCWVVATSNNLHWINDAPRLTMLLVCTGLLGHIMWLLWRTYKNKLNENHPTLRTVKAFIVCMPLFGLTYLLFLVIPNTESCAGEQCYYFFSYLFDGLQGLFVAVLHCYRDKDVKKIIIRKYEDIAFYFNFKSNRKRRSTLTNSRFTNVTSVDAHQAVDINNNLLKNDNEKNFNKNLPNIIPISSITLPPSQQPSQDGNSKIDSDEFTKSLQNVNDKNELNVMVNDTIKNINQENIILNPQALLRDRGEGITFIETNENNEKLI